MAFLNGGNHSMNLDIRKNDNSSIIQSRSCDNLCVQSETVTPCEMKRLQTEKQFSDDLGYFNKQNYLSFSTCSSASTDLNFEELTNRLDEIKQKYTENNTSKIVDILSECIYKEADDVDDITTVNSTKHNLLYTTVTSGPSLVPQATDDNNKIYGRIKSDDRLHSQICYHIDKSTQTTKNNTNNSIDRDSIASDNNEGLIVHKGTIVIPCKGIKLVLTSDHCKIIIDNSP